MKKLILITIFLMSAILSFGQKKQKWLVGQQMLYIGNYKIDTLTTTYYLDGKDSVSVEMVKEDCKCKFYIQIGETKHRSCVGLKRYYLYTKYWNWYKDIKKAKGKVISERKPYWESHMGQYSFVDGTFIQNNRAVYPSYIFLNKLYKTNLN